MTTYIGQYVTIKDDVQICENCRIEDGARIYEGCKIGENTIIGANAVLRPNTIIGKNSIFGTLSCSEGDNTIGSNTTIHAQCHLTKKVTIGNNVFIAPFFLAANTQDITEGLHGRNHCLHLVIKPTIIEDNVRMGVCVRMIPGLTVGKYSMIDMDTLLTKDVPEYSHVRGGRDKVGRIIGSTKPK